MMALAERCGTCGRTIGAVSIPHVSDETIATMIREVAINNGHVFIFYGKRLALEGHTQSCPAPSSSVTAARRGVMT